jgi:hypothetical protein
MSLSLQDRDVTPISDFNNSSHSLAMSAVLSTNWLSNDSSGDLQQLLQSAEQCAVHLHKPSEGEDVGPCTVTLDVQPQVRVLLLLIAGGCDAAAALSNEEAMRCTFDCRCRAPLTSCCYAATQGWSRSQ